MSINYIVQEGECISSIAFDNGFTPETLWDHPSNAQLKQRRQNPNVLMPGDSVFVPSLRPKEVSGATNQVHKFRLKNTPAKLRIQFMFEGEPRANVPYELLIDGNLMSQPGSRTDGQGFVFYSIPPNAKSGSLVLFEDGQETEYELVIGSLNPGTGVSGSHQRLFNLGHYFGPITSEFTEETKEAVLEFQKAMNLPETGELDEATKNKLQSTHDLL